MEGQDRLDRGGLRSIKDRKTRSVSDVSEDHEPTIREWAYFFHLVQRVL